MKIKCEDIFLPDIKIDTLNNNIFKINCKKVESKINRNYKIIPFKYFLSLIKNPSLIFYPFIKMKYKYYYKYRVIKDKELALRFKEFYLSKFYNHVNENSLILDFGCGQGRFIGLLNQLGLKKIIGQDIAYFKEWENYKANFVIVPLECETFYPYKDNIFDIIFSIQVIMFLNDKQLEEHIKSLSRILKPGGYLILEDRNSNSLNLKYFKKNKFCPYVHMIEKIKLYLEKYGFEIIEIKTFGNITKKFYSTFSFLIALLLPKKKFDIFEFYNRFWIDKVVKFFIPAGREKLVLFICKKK